MSITDLFSSLGESLRRSINIDDLIVGSAVIILSLCIVVAHLLILKEIWFDPELAKLPSYRLLFLIGTFDIIQCTAHFATGVFTICQTTFFPLLGKLMGSLATPGYVGYSLLCVVLAVNRLVQLTSPHSGRYFAGRRFYYWLIGVSVIWLTFVFILSSPWATISYIPEKYSWGYDKTLQLSSIVQVFELYIELACIAISLCLYLFVIIGIYRMRKQLTVSSGFKTEIRILVQALVIALYCTALNLLWHNKWLIGNDKWTLMACNFMWIFNSAVQPIVHLILNRCMRRRAFFKHLSQKKVHVMAE
ncbi:hypothetical protein Y032_0567g30, partial [Ancylostoma ceylanicum]